MKIIVTGATSMNGVALIKECIKNNCEVLAIVRNNPERVKRLPKSNLIKLVYSDLEHLDDIESDEKYDIFYHYAWGPNVKSARDNLEAQETNLKATISAIKLASRLGCKKFIGIGSQAEYGPTNDLITTETECHPINAYGICKFSAYMMGKHLCEQSGIIFIWGRIFSVYGTNDNNGTMLDYAIKCFLNNEKATFTSGLQYWNYLYEDDAGKMFYLLGSNDVKGGIYNIANNISKPLKEYVKILADSFDGKVNYEFTDKEAVGLNVDVSKTINAIGYEPSTSFENGIKNMIDAYKLKERNINE